MSEIYYCKDEKEFYYVRQTSKRISIDWIERGIDDLIFDSNVRWKKLVINKIKNNGNILKDLTENEILVYPNKADLPFYLVKATEKLILEKIKSCVKSGACDDYYQGVLELFKLTNFNNEIKIKREIKFNHKYKKLIDNYPHYFDLYTSSAKLLEVFNVNLEDLSKDFLNYDTDNDKYKLPKKGKYIMLLLLRYKSNNIFTTIRRWTPEKEKYYRENIGNLFDIEYADDLDVNKKGGA